MDASEHLPDFLEVTFRNQTCFVSLCVVLCLFMRCVLSLFGVLSLGPGPGRARAEQKDQWTKFQKKHKNEVYVVRLADIS